MTLVTSFRMYEVTPVVKNAWRDLFAPVFADIGADVRFVDHAYPQPIASLWQAPGLFATFMCGWPFVHAHRAMQPIAAPVPAPPRYAGLPRYCSEFLVREQSGFQSLEDTFDHRIGWMPQDSQSGFNAPRALLAQHVNVERRTLYRESRGPFATPAQLLDALRAGEVDVVAVDGFFLDLVRQHERSRVGGLRTIATTPWTPIPLLVAAPDVDTRLVARLRDHLLRLHKDAVRGRLLADVLVDRFVVPDVAAYSTLEAMSRFALEHGYEAIR